MSIKAYFFETRPNFLILPFVLIFLGTAMAWYSGYSNFVYTIPLIVVLVLGNRELQTERQLLPPQLTSLFTLATLASLITTGGFVQMISRRGLFYLPV